MIHRGEIYWGDFRGAGGAEIRKVRPAVVVSCQDHNSFMQTVTVVPLSSARGRVHPQEVSLPAGILGDGRASRLVTHQLRTVDKKRLGRKFGDLPASLMPALEYSLCEHLGLE
ncbi:MAG: type II toxin-antitoxin system PemK/MazF family toxin [Elusimicrobiota bacterium]